MAGKARREDRQSKHGRGCRQSETPFCLPRSSILWFDCDCAVVPPGPVADDQGTQRSRLQSHASHVATNNKEWHFCKLKGYTFRRCLCLHLNRDFAVLSRHSADLNRLCIEIKVNCGPPSPSDHVDPDFIDQALPLQSVFGIPFMISRTLRLSALVAITISFLRQRDVVHCPLK
jgi:hypothetical protein